MTGGTVPDERTLLAALDVVDVALALVGSDKRIQYANAAYGEFVTHTPAAIEGTSIFGLGCPCDGLAGLEDEWDRRDFLSVTGESPEGSIVDVVVRPLGQDSDVRLVLVRRGMVRALASRQLPPDVVRHLQEFLVELTGHGGDPTMLSAAPLSILLLGIENLEGLRAEHGDETVEAVLRQVAQALVLQKRKADIIGRYRDGQFLVIAPDTPRHGAVMLADRIRRRVESLEFETHGHPVPISIATYAAEYRPQLDGTIREAVERGVATISAPAAEPSA